MIPLAISFLLWPWCPCYLLSGPPSIL